MFVGSDKSSVLVQNQNKVKVYKNLKQNDSLVLQKICQNVNVEVNRSLKTHNPICVKEYNNDPIIQEQNQGDANHLAQIADKNTKSRQENKAEKQRQFNEQIKQRAKMIQKENQEKKKKEQMKKELWKSQMLNRNKISFSQSTIQQSKVVKGKTVIQPDSEQIQVRVERHIENTTTNVEQSINTTEQNPDEEEQQQPPQPIQQQEQNLQSITEQIQEEEEKQPKAQVYVPNDEDMEDQDSGSDDEIDAIFDCQNRQDCVNKYSAIRQHLRNYNVPKEYSETYSEMYGQPPVFDSLLY